MQPKILFEIIGGNITVPTSTTIILQVDSYFYYKSTFVDFVTTPTVGKVTIGVDASATTANLANFMFDIWAADLDCVTKVGNDIFINAFGITVTLDGKFGDYEAGDVEPQWMLARSPYHLRINPIGYSFDQAVTELRIWRGDIVTDRPTDPTYTLQKSIIRADQTMVDFVINEFVQDKLKVAFENYYDQTLTNQFSNINESVWVEASTKIYLVTTDQEITAVKQWLALDGWGKHEQGMNPTIPINMNSITNGVFNQFIPFYYRANNDGLSVILNGDPIIGLDYEYTNISNKNIYVFSVKCNDLSNIPLVIDDVLELRNSLNNETILTLKYIDICGNFNLIYKNRFGVWNGIPFPKRDKASIKKESVTYSPVIASFGDYNPIDHAKRTRNVKGTKTITLNTDFLPEDYNNAFEDLLMSEYVYLQTDTDTFTPVLVVTDSLQFKQKKFDRMIQYTIEVEVANNIINQIY